MGDCRGGGDGDAGLFLLSNGRESGAAFSLSSRTRIVMVEARHILFAGVDQVPVLYVAAAIQWKMESNNSNAGVDVRFW